MSKLFVVGRFQVSSLLPPRLRPYCPATCKAPSPNMISGATNFRNAAPRVCVTPHSRDLPDVLKRVDDGRKFEGCPVRTILGWTPWCALYSFQIKYAQQVSSLPRSLECSGSGRIVSAAGL
jgi:hypothetical protein